MRAVLLTLILLLSFPSPTVRAGDNYYSLTPPFGGTPLDVGPYTYLGIGGCKDWLGGAETDVTPRCAGTCDESCPCFPVGNGFAYPADWPYPPPFIITSDNCYKGRRYSSQPLRYGYYFAEYGDGFGEIRGPFNGFRSCGRHRLRDQAKGNIVGKHCFWVG